MTKPSHRGRILVSSRLQPLGTSQSYDHSRPSQPQPSLKEARARRGSGSRSAEPTKGILVADGSSALRDGVGKAELQRVVAELEVENQRLRNNLEKAELSVESYRGFLSAKSASRVHSISTQTDFVVVSKSKSVNDKISSVPPKMACQQVDMTKKAQESEAIIQSLRNELSSTKEQVTLLQRSASDLKNDLSKCKMNMEIAEVSYKAQISTLEKDLNNRKLAPKAGGASPVIKSPNLCSKKFPVSPKEQSAGPHADSPVKPLTPSSSTKKIKLNVSKSSMLCDTRPPEMIISPIPSTKKLSKSSSKKLSSPNVHLGEPTLSPKVKLRQETLSTGVIALSSKISTTKNKFSQEAQLISNELNEFRLHFSNCVRDLISEVSRVQECNKLQHIQLREESKSVKAELEHLATSQKSSHDNVKLERDFSLLKKSMQDLEYQKKSAESNYEATLKDKDARISNLSTIFTSISREMNNLSEKFKSETAAVKHMGHCRDLVRVASIRELKLDKDKAVSELKYARDVQNVLAFCLETAEKSLNEVQPEVVARLHESRIRRTKLLEKEVMERRKDLDQRSAETCAVSSTHLEAFEEKSKIKHKRMAEETQAVLAEIQHILNVRGSQVDKHLTEI